MRRKGSRTRRRNEHGTKRGVWMGIENDIVRGERRYSLSFNENLSLNILYATRHAHLPSCLFVHEGFDNHKLEESI